MTDTPLRLRPDGTRRALFRGEFCYVREEGGPVKWLHFWPWECLAPITVSIAPQRNAGGATWTLSGTEEAPTLTPSVNAVGIWHGWLTDGVARQ